MHFDRGGARGPSTVFAIEDYLGEKHGIKIAYDYLSEFRIGFKRAVGSTGTSGDYRPIVGMAYDDRAGALKVEYYHKGPDAHSYNLAKAT